MKITAPPDITVEKSWVHASEGFDIDLVCRVQGDVNSEVNWVKLSFEHQSYLQIFCNLDALVPKLIPIRPNWPAFNACQWG